MLGRRLAYVRQPFAPFATRLASSQWPAKSSRHSSKMANLGKLIETIRLYMPTMLHDHLPRSVISQNICLSLQPELHQFPQIHGRTSYFSAIRIIQFTATSLFIPKESGVAILSARLTPDVPPTRTDGAEVLPTTYTVKFRTSADSTRTGILPLIPSDYPMLCGTFEFDFDSEYKQITKHTITNVEYYSEPEVKLDVC